MTTVNVKCFVHTRIDMPQVKRLIRSVNNILSQKGITVLIVEINNDIKVNKSALTLIKKSMNKIINCLLFLLGVKMFLFNKGLYFRLS
jgi:hypothetical protein